MGKAVTSNLTLAEPAETSCDVRQHPLELQPQETRAYRFPYQRSGDAVEPILNGLRCFQRPKTGHRTGRRFDVIDEAKAIETDLTMLQAPGPRPRWS